MKDNIRLYFTFTDRTQEGRLKDILRAACEGIDLEFMDNPARADILITDTPGAFAGVTPINGQLFAITHTHGHSLPSHYRVLDRDNPARKLIKIVKEKHASPPVHDFRVPDEVLSE